MGYLNTQRKVQDDFNNKNQHRYMQTLKISAAFLLCLMYYQIFGQQSQDKFTLTAELTGFNNNTKFYLVNLDSTQNIDSVYLKQGQLIFRGKVSEPVTFRLYPENDKVYFNLWIENKDITITGDRNNFSDLQVKGSPLNKIYFSALQKHATLDKTRDSLTTKAIKETDETKAREIWKNISLVDQEVLKIRLQSIASFPPSLITIKELYFLRNDLTTDSLKRLFDKFPINLKKSKYGNVINQYVSTNNLKAGSYAPEITGKTLTGQGVKLSDYKGKVILLDFWASWCGSCRESNKSLSTLFLKFKGEDFEIVSFSIDTDFESWKIASNQDQISWTNISDLKGLYSNQAASYKIRAIPKSFLIDRNGVIVEFFTGFGKDTENSLEKKIIELIK
jgi:peroxiredoxin